MEPTAEGAIQRKTIRLPVALGSRLNRLARGECRSVTAQIEWIVGQFLASPDRWASEGAGSAMLAEGQPLDRRTIRMPMPMYQQVKQIAHESNRTVTAQFAWIVARYFERQGMRAS